MDQNLEQRRLGLRSNFEKSTLEFSLVHTFGGFGVIRYRNSNKLFGKK